MNQVMRVTLIEDNSDYRTAVQLALEDFADLDLISQFGTSEIAVRTLKESNEEKLPDIILLDLRLPGMDGLDSIPILRSHAPDAKIIVLTQSNQEKDVLRAISLGASGYLLKSATVDELTAGIRTVANGGAALESGVAKLILDSLQTRLPSENDESLLSKREIEILNLLADGKVKKQIAKELGIGYSTVDTHVGRIYSKLNVNNAPSAINKAHQMRILPSSGEE